MTKGEEGNIGMRIKIIEPGVYADRASMERLNNAYEADHDPDTELSWVALDRGIESPEQHFWESLQMTFLTQEIERTDQAYFDGVVIFCAADPGVSAAKECLRIPVVGIMETSVALANFLGRRFTWLSPLSRGNGFMLDKIRSTGLADRLASIRSIEVPFTDMENDSALLDKTIAEGRKAINADNADTLIIGCTGMVGLASEAQEALGIPVIDAGVVGIRMCEALVKMNLAQSKRAYPAPREDMRRFVDVTV
ncbi:aspartate/glutamate racemase family protein [Rhizobium sp. ZPR3]|uniref:Aspartate/glutamate racemase family protein n=2 Tax=unclassified Rhizobium TaxID=2613769 RepID=A0AAU7SRD2_9HYPH